MQHTTVILTILLPEVFRRKWAQKWPIFDETPLYRKSFKFAEYARGAGPGRVVSPIQFSELILNNRPRFARAMRDLEVRLAWKTRHMHENQLSESAPFRCKHVRIGGCRRAIRATETQTT